MFCSRCGGEIVGGAAFCPSCGAPQGVSAPPMKKKPRWLIPAVIGGIVLVVALAAAAAFALGIVKPEPAADYLTGTWDGVGAGEAKEGTGAEDVQDSPSQLTEFQSAASCNATCHTPMDPYVATFDQETGSPGTDKWGNAVASTVGILCVSHKAQGYDCLSCHQLTDAEISSLASAWATGNYVDPLEERDLGFLVEAQGIEADQFCLNESCHNVTRVDLVSATSDMNFNPHSDQHGEMACSECHKAHRASVNYCTGCHDAAEVPEGWLSASATKELAAY